MSDTLVANEIYLRSQATSHPLMKRLRDNGSTVLPETSGALDISKVDAHRRRVLDLKCTCSSESGRNRREKFRCPKTPARPPAPGTP